MRLLVRTQHELETMVKFTKAYTLRKLIFRTVELKNSEPVSVDVDEIRARFELYPDEICAIVVKSEDEEFLDLVDTICKYNSAVLIVVRY